MGLIFGYMTRKTIGNVKCGLIALVLYSLFPTHLADLLHQPTGNPSQSRLMRIEIINCHTPTHWSKMYMGEIIHVVPHETDPQLFTVRDPSIEIGNVRELTIHRDCCEELE